MWKNKNHVYYQVWPSSLYQISHSIESYNKITKIGQIDNMVVRYWNTEKDMVDTRYLKLATNHANMLANMLANIEPTMLARFAASFSSEFLGKEKAKDILYKFQSFSSDLEKNKILQVSSDGRM